MSVAVAAAAVAATSQVLLLNPSMLGKCACPLTCAAVRQLDGVCQVGGAAAGLCTLAPVAIIADQLGIDVDARNIIHNTAYLLLGVLQEVAQQRGFSCRADTRINHCCGFPDGCVRSCAPAPRKPLSIVTGVLGGADILAPCSCSEHNEVPCRSGCTACPVWDVGCPRDSDSTAIDTPAHDVMWEHRAAVITQFELQLRCAVVRYPSCTKQGPASTSTQSWFDLARDADVHGHAILGLVLSRQLVFQTPRSGWVTAALLPICNQAVGCFSFEGIHSLHTASWPYARTHSGVSRPQQCCDGTCNSL